MPMNFKDEIVAGESYSLEFKRVPNEDFGALFSDLAAWPEDSAPHDWLRGLLATA